jgi:hypothetical protein
MHFERELRSAEGGTSMKRKMTVVLKTPQVVSKIAFEDFDSLVLSLKKGQEKYHRN